MFADLNIAAPKSVVSTQPVKGFPADLRPDTPSLGVSFIEYVTIGPSLYDLAKNEQHIVS